MSAIERNGSDASRRNRLSLANRRQRSRAVLNAEPLEGRALLASLFFNSGTGVVTFQASGTGANLSVSLNAGTLTFNNTTDSINLIGQALTSGFFTGDGTQTVTVADSHVNSIFLSGGPAIDTFRVLSTDKPITVDTATGNDPNNYETLNLGNNGSLLGINANIVQVDTGGPNVTTAQLSIDATNDAAGTVQFNSGFPTGNVHTQTQVITGILPNGHTVTYGQGIGRVNYQGGTNGNNITVNQPIVSDTSVLNVGTGGGADTVAVNAVNSGLTLNLDTQAGSDTVTLGNGKLSALEGTVNLATTGGAAALVLNDTTDNTSSTIGISSTAITSNGFNTINYGTGNYGPITFNGGPGTGPMAYSVTGTKDSTVTNLNGGSNVNLVYVTGTGANSTLNVTGGAAGDSLSIRATSATSTVNVDGAGGSNTVTIGGVGGVGAQNVLGPVNVSDATGTTSLILNDFGNTTPYGTVPVLTGTSLTGFAPGLISYTAPSTSGGNGVSQLGVLAGNSAGNTINVNGTLANSVGPTYTTLQAAGSTTINVLATTSNGNNTALIVSGFGDNNVNIGNGNSVSQIRGKVFIDNSSRTNIAINAQFDTETHTFTLVSTNANQVQPGQPVSVLTTTSGDNTPAEIAFRTSHINTLVLSTSASNSQTLNVDFSGPGGNPIPTNVTPGLVFNGGANSGSNPGSHTLNLYGTPVAGAFTSETHNAAKVPNGAIASPNVQQGDIFLTDPFSNVSQLVYTGLSPIHDVVPAVNYTFNDLATPDQSFSATDGPAFGGAATTLRFASTTTPIGFEQTDVANKTNIVFLTPASPGSSGVTGIVNLPTAPTGLSTLLFNTPTNGDNFVSFVATPSAVVTSLVGSGEEDVTNVSGTGVASGTTLTVNGGAGVDTLNYNSGGLKPTVTAGAPGSGEVLISVPGAGTVDALNYENINISGAASQGTITPGPARTINTIEGYQLTDQVVGTFTLPLGAVVPGLPPGFAATSFTSTITWGDGSTSAGTVKQDASNPSTYYISGSHIYATRGSYSLSTQVAFSGGTVSVPFNGTNINLTFAPIAATTGPIAPTNVINGTLAVSAFPVVGTEGASVPSAAIATFIDGGFNPATGSAANYTATITAIDPRTGLPVAGINAVAASSITQNGNSGSFTVIAPALTFPETGSYQLRVSVNKATTTISASGDALAVIKDAPLTAGAVVNLTPNTGIKLSSTVVANFTDANTSAPLSDFTAVIDWGDGTATSLGTIGGAVGAYTVSGTHAYATPGVYATKIIVTDVGGSVVTLAGTATVTDLAVTGTVRSFTGVEGQDTGTILLATFTNPNPLATISSVSATLAANGWGDGTPASAGIPLTVQQIGANGSGTIFQVFGSHKYLEEGSFTVNITVTTTGGAVTNLTAGTATIADAALTGAGAFVQGTEGLGLSQTGSSTFGSVILGTFTDADQAGTIADYTSGGGSVVVNFGDGSAPVTLTAANLTQSGSPNGVVFTISAPHVYAETGVYQIVTTVTDSGGASTVLHGTATIADAPLTAAVPQPTVNVTEGIAFTIPIASFNDANPTAPVSDFKAVIDWGDGTPTSFGSFSQIGGVGTTFSVSGLHTYATSGVDAPAIGHYTITVQVIDRDGATVTLINTANVTNPPIPVTGILNPADDTGISNSDNITKINTPTFYGNTQPYAQITLSATPTAGGVPIVLGSTSAGSTGAWSLKSTVALPDGVYSISATAKDKYGYVEQIVSGSTSVFSKTLIPSLTIDTIGPVVTHVFFDRVKGQINVTYTDNLSGVFDKTLVDASNYSFSKVHIAKQKGINYLITNATVAPGANATTETVVLTIDGGRYIRGGFYNFVIASASPVKTSGVQDISGNALDGEFYGYFPSGNKTNGGDFAARLDAIHNLIYAPSTVVGTATPNVPPGTPGQTVRIPTVKPVKGKFHPTPAGPPLAIVSKAAHVPSPVAVKNAKRHA